MSKFVIVCVCVFVEASKYLGIWCQPFFPWRQISPAHFGFHYSYDFLWSALHVRNRKVSTGIFEPLCPILRTESKTVKPEAQKWRHNNVHMCRSESWRKIPGIHHRKCLQLQSDGCVSWRKLGQKSGMRIGVQLCIFKIHREWMSQNYSDCDWGLRLDTAGNLLSRPFCYL